MARQGFFGEVVHGDCAYNTSKMGNNFSKTMLLGYVVAQTYAARRGNIYPTHGLGPVCQIMNINRGDQLDFLVSVESKDFMMAKKARELAQSDAFFKRVCRERVSRQYEHHADPDGAGANHHAAARRHLALAA